MNYHVFIVDENTFKYHLEYGFAGTGAVDKQSPFLLNALTNEIHSTTERNLVGMIADVSRIRVGDKIIFYLQSRNEREGMFFGVYRAKSIAFFDENDSNNYLVNYTKKGLSYRILIEVDEIYQYGITEHEYLDSLDGIDYPHQMCWSLIYRKLKGNRGCTMITDYEFKKLYRKLKNKNNNQTIASLFTNYNQTNNCIVIGQQNNYTGSLLPIDVAPRLIYKANRGNAFEVHLQAYIMQNFDKLVLGTLYDFIATNTMPNCWVGNEVSCGVGMQRIDVMIIQQNDTDVYIKIIELKCCEPYSGIVTNQIPWYIKWVSEYISPNYIRQGKSVHILPCIVALHTTDSNFLNTLNASVPCSVNQSLYISAIQFIPFTITKTQITF